MEKFVRNSPRPCDPFFLCVWQKKFFPNFSKKCRIFFSMKLTLKNFGNFFTEISSKKFQIFFQWPKIDY